MDHYKKKKQTVLETQEAPKQAQLEFVKMKAEPTASHKLGEDEREKRLGLETTVKEYEVNNSLKNHWQRRTNSFHASLNTSAINSRENVDKLFSDENIDSTNFPNSPSKFEKREKQGEIKTDGIHGYVPALQIHGDSAFEFVPLFN
jgi:hypothetical protein